MGLKRLLILAVVFAFASAANAIVLSWSIDAVTIYSTSGTAVVTFDADEWGNYAEVKWVGNDPTSVATIASIVPLPAAGPDAVVWNPAQTTYPGWWTVMAADFGPTGPAQSGPQFSVTIQAQGTGTHFLHSDFYGTDDLLEITVVPEPMTVALLALGSLALLGKRRR